MLTPDNVEHYLDSGQLEAAMLDGRWWKCRRNGRTKRWKTRPFDFRIPIKAGFRSYGTIEAYHFNDINSYFRIKQG